MRKYLYTTLLLALLAQEGVMAQENEGKKGGFFGKIKDTFSTEIKIGKLCFKAFAEIKRITDAYLVRDFRNRQIIF